MAEPLPFFDEPLAAPLDFLVEASAASAFAPLALAAAPFALGLAEPLALEELVRLLVGAAELAPRRARARVVLPSSFEADLRAETRLAVPFFVVAFDALFLALVVLLPVPRAFVAILTSRALLPENAPE